MNFEVTLTVSDGTSRSSHTVSVESDDGDDALMLAGSVLSMACSAMRREFGIGALVYAIGHSGLEMDYTGSEWSWAWDKLIFYQNGE